MLPLFNYDQNEKDPANAKSLAHCWVAVDIAADIGGDCCTADYDSVASSSLAC